MCHFSYCGGRPSIFAPDMALLSFLMISLQLLLVASMQQKRWNSTGFVTVKGSEFQLNGL